MGVSHTSPNFEIYRFAGKNGGTMYFSRASDWTQDHGSTKVSKTENVINKNFGR